MGDNRSEAELGWGAGLSAGELAQMRSVKSAFVNRVYVRPYGANVRIALGELIEGETHWHSSIVVPADALIEIAELMRAQAQWTVNWVESQRIPAAEVFSDAE